VASLVLTSSFPHQNATTSSSSQDDAQAGSALSCCPAACTALLLAAPKLRSLQPSCFSSSSSSYTRCLLASPWPWTLRWWTVRNWSPNISELTQPGEEPVALAAGACSLMWCGGSLSSPVQDKDGFQPSVVFMWSQFALSLFW